MEPPPLPILRPVCPACGTWVCSKCGWKRTTASRYGRQVCAECFSTEGNFLDVRHIKTHIYDDHIDAWKEFIKGGKSGRVIGYGESL